jgi:hypothetical protein
VGARELGLLTVTYGIEEEEKKSFLAFASSDTLCCHSGSVGALVIRPDNLPFDLAWRPRLPPIMHVVF